MRKVQKAAAGEAQKAWEVEDKARKKRNQEVQERYKLQMKAYDEERQ